jgi:hypothetical protein
MTFFERKFGASNGIESPSRIVWPAALSLQERVANDLVHVPGAGTAKEDDLLTPFRLSGMERWPQPPKDGRPYFACHSQRIEPSADERHLEAGVGFLHGHIR